MYKGKTFLGIIPARSGSKRLPNKNRRLLAGKPLIAWSIEEALKSKYIDEVMITTDDKVISDLSKEMGATVPFIRPKHLSTDEANSIDVIKHTLEFYTHELNKKFDYIILLQPTSPLRTSVDIDNAIAFLFRKKAKAVVSVCETEHSPLWANTLPDNFSMKNFRNTKFRNKRSQDLPVFYRLNGAIYISDTNSLIQQNTFIWGKTYAYIMSQEKSVDIDNELDFKLAEVLINNRFLE